MESKISDKSEVIFYFYSSTYCLIEKQFVCAQMIDLNRNCALFFVSACNCVDEKKRNENIFWNFILLFSAIVYLVYWKTFAIEKVLFFNQQYKPGAMSRK